MATVILTNTFRCRNCGCIGMPHDDVTTMTFPGNGEEPAEYEPVCPECGSDDVQEELTHSCRGCLEVQVQPPEEYCDECIGAIADARSESMKDSEWGAYDAV